MTYHHHTITGFSFVKTLLKYYPETLTIPRVILNLFKIYPDGGMMIKWVNLVTKIDWCK